jgi:hypothetical protein
MNELNVGIITILINLLLPVFITSLTTPKQLGLDGFSNFSHYDQMLHILTSFSKAPVASSAILVVFTFIIFKIYHLFNNKERAKTN